MIEVVGTTGCGATDISDLPIFIDNQLGFAGVAFLFTGLVGLLRLIITRPLDGLFGGINQSPQIGTLSQGLVNPFTLTALRWL